MRGPAPLEPDADDTQRVAWLLAELDYQTRLARQSWAWAMAALAMNLGAVAFTVWGWLT